MANVVEGVGHDDAIKLWQIERMGKVCDSVFHIRGREVGAHGFFLLFERSFVFVDAVNFA